MSTSAVGKIRLLAAQSRLDLANHVISHGDTANQQQYGEALTADVTMFGEALAAYRTSGPARLTSTGVTESEQATADLARMSGELTDLVGTFRY
jgi:hypothetical protein